MIETGIVESIAGGIAQIRTDKSAGCFGCLNYECKENKGSFQAQNQLNLPLEKGQWVEVEIPTASALSQAAFALLPILLGFIAGYLLAGKSGLKEEGARAFCGVLGLFAAAFAVYIVRRRHPPQGMSRIVRIVRKWELGNGERTF